MKKGFIKNILIFLLAGTLVFAAFKYISSLKENISNLESQKQNLLQELEKERNAIEKLRLNNNSLKNNLQAAHKRINKSFSDVRFSEKRFEELNLRISLLKAENAALSEEKTKLTYENEVFKSTLTSISELKAIIQELKRLKRQMGNRGFIIKSGKSTTVAKVKIEVVPAPAK